MSNIFKHFFYNLKFLTHVQLVFIIRTITGGQNMKKDKKQQYLLKILNAPLILYKIVVIPVNTQKEKIYFGTASITIFRKIV